MEADLDYEIDSQYLCTGKIGLPLNYKTEL